MISVNRRTLYGEVYNDVRCLSSDEKPTEGIKNGSTLIEMDTGKRYLYDALSGQWNEFSQGGGGGGDYVLPTMSPTTKGGAKVGAGLSISGDSLSVDYSEVASVDALEEATALSPTGGIVSTQDGLAISPAQQTTGAIDGALLELTAKSKPATQASTTGKNLWPFGSTWTSEADNSNPQMGALALSAGTYTFSLECLSFTSSANNNFQLLFYNSNNERVITPAKAIAVGKQTITVTLSQDASYVSFYTGAAWSIKDVQLELGSTATDYEPYTGGAPSPSPDYPQEIVTVRGRNLIDESQSSEENAYLNSNGTVEASANWNISEYIPASAGAYRIELSTAGNLPSICAYDSNKSYISGKKYDGNISISFTAPSNTSYIRVSYRKNGNAQLTEGSTPQPYVPYGYVGLESQKKNLLDESKAVYNNNYKVFGGVLSSNLPDGTLVLDAGTYTVSSNIESKMLSVRKTDGSEIARIANGDRTTFAIDENESVKITFEKAVSQSWLDFSLQLEHGSTATDYEPYHHITTPIPLPSRGWVAGLPDGTTDELRLDGAGKVVWTLPTSEVVLDGSSDESWYSNGTTGYSYRNISSGMIRVDGDVNTNVMSDMYRPVFMSDLNGVGTFVNNGIHIYDGSWIIFGDTRASTTSEFKALIAANPVTVLFPLATPVTEDCGYIEGWTNDFSEGCVLSIPELDDLGIKYHIDGAVSTLVHQWYERARYEYEDRIDALESAVAELVAGA